MLLDCRRLNVRIKEHAKKYTMKDENSSLYTHTKENDHTIDLTSVKILDIEANRGKRLFSEALHIHTQTNYMMLCRGSYRSEERGI